MHVVKVLNGVLLTKIKGHFCVYLYALTDETDENIDRMTIISC